MSSLNNIWNTKHLSIQTKGRVHQTLVLSVLLYASETWTFASDMKPSNPFTWSVSEGFLESGGMILSVTLRFLYALVSHLCPTGLPEVAMPSLDMWQECQITLQHTRPCYAKSSYRSVNPQTLHGNVHQADHIPNGPTNSAVTTTMFPLRLCEHIAVLYFGLNFCSICVAGPSAVWSVAFRSIRVVLRSTFVIGIAVAYCCAKEQCKASGLTVQRLKHVIFVKIFRTANYKCTTSSSRCFLSHLLVIVTMQWMWPPVPVQYVCVSLLDIRNEKHKHAELMR